MSKQKNIPQLRFPEFKGEWENKKLGEICKMQAGKFVNASDIRELDEVYKYPCYGGNGLRGFTKTYNQEGKFSLIGRQGAHCGNVNLANGKFYATEHAVVVNIFEGFETDFIYLILGNLNLNQYSTGLAQPGLSVQNIEKIETYLSSTLPEQTKIANFLTAVDEKLQALKKKKSLLEAYKKGVMQKLFSQELRFKDENGEGFPEWEEKKLGEIGTFQTSSIDKLTKENEKEVCLVNYMNVYRHEDINNKTVKTFQIVTAKDNQIESCNLKRGDILFTPSSETPDDIGHSVVIFEDLENAVFSYHLMRFRPNIEIDILYSHYFCNIPDVLKQLSKLANGSTRFTISVGSFSSVIINLPSMKEQTAIANFLSSIDDKINQTNAQIEKTEQWKKGLLQKMFV